MELTSKTLTIVIGIFIFIIVFWLLYAATDKIKDSAKDSIKISAGIVSFGFMKKRNNPKQKGLISMLPIFIIVLAIVAIMLGAIYLWQPDIIKSASSFYYVRLPRS